MDVNEIRQKLLEAAGQPQTVEADGFRVTFPTLRELAELYRLLAAEQNTKQPFQVIKLVPPGTA